MSGNQSVDVEYSLAEMSAIGIKVGADIKKVFVGACRRSLRRIAEALSASIRARLRSECARAEAFSASAVTSKCRVESFHPKLFMNLTSRHI